MPERSRRFNMLLSDDEETMLEYLAERRGLTSSDVLRTLLRVEFDKATSKTGTNAQNVGSLRALKNARARAAARAKGGK